MKVLAGDIGGTNSRLALCDVAGGRVSVFADQTYPSASFSSLSDVVRTFLFGRDEPVHSACFGLPGPVRGRRVKLTNLPWLVDADAMERELGLDVLLINDLEANAYGLSVLDPASVRVLKPGTGIPNGNAALIAAGTGLGEAGLAWDGTRRRPFATEGGHCDFAPADEVEDELLAWLRKRHDGHVSWERVVSGPGLAAIHEFLRERAGEPMPAWAEVTAAELPGRISAAATGGADPIAHEALQRFLALYGAEAGNLALKLLAIGGVYVGGGIAPKLADEFASSAFVERFMAKGRMRALMEDMPVYLVLDDRAGLWGAASHAAARRQANNG
jgi:glucokinase